MGTLTSIETTQTGRYKQTAALAALSAARWALTRWAPLDNLLGALRYLMPERLIKCAELQLGEPAWSTDGGRALLDGPCGCPGNSALVRAHSALSTLALEAVLMGAVEACKVDGEQMREQDVRSPEEAFDPLHLADNADTPTEPLVNGPERGQLG